MTNDEGGSLHVIMEGRLEAIALHVQSRYIHCSGWFKGPSPYLQGQSSIAFRDQQLCVKINTCISLWMPVWLGSDIVSALFVLIFTSQSENFIPTFRHEEDT